MTPKIDSKSERKGYSLSTDRNSKYCITYGQRLAKVCNNIPLAFYNIILLSMHLSYFHLKQFNFHSGDSNQLYEEKNSE